MRKSWPADKDLSSWTGLGRSGHDQSQSSDSISHVSGPKDSETRFLIKVLNDSAWLSVEKLKKHCFLDSSAQNHAESFGNCFKTQFWIQNMRNLTKTLTSVMSGPPKPVQEDKSLSAKHVFPFFFF